MERSCLYLQAIRDTPSSRNKCFSHKKNFGGKSVGKNCWIPPNIVPIDEIRYYILRFVKIVSRRGPSRQGFRRPAEALLQQVSGYILRKECNQEGTGRPVPSFCMGCGQTGIKSGYITCRRRCIRGSIGWEVCCASCGVGKLMIQSPP